MYHTKRVYCVPYQKGLLCTIPKGPNVYHTNMPWCVIPKGLAVYHSKRAYCVPYQKGLLCTIPTCLDVSYQRTLCVSCSKGLLCVIPNGILYVMMLYLRASFQDLTMTNNPSRIWIPLRLTTLITIPVYMVISDQKPLMVYRNIEAYCSGNCQRQIVFNNTRGRLLPTAYNTT